MVSAGGTRGGLCVGIDAMECPPNDRVSTSYILSRGLSSENGLDQDRNHSSHLGTQVNNQPDARLLQVHRPVGVVEEGAPGLVFAASEFEVEERAAFGFFGLADQGHAGLLGGAAAFANVAAHAGADDVVPVIVAALAARNDVIQAQLGGRILAA